MRCPWPGDDPLLVEYHDDEWGVPVRDEAGLFEALTLESAQSGLSWRTVLARREGYREAFAGFDADIVAGFTAADIDRLLADPGIIRHRGKIEATIGNARAYLEIEGEMGFDRYLWAFCDGAPIQNSFRTMAEVPAETPLSKAISKDLKARGFKFCGPTIVYAFMQATGMVNDHMVGCFRHKAVQRGH